MQYGLHFDPALNKASIKYQSFKWSNLNTNCTFVILRNDSEFLQFSSNWLWHGPANVMEAMAITSKTKL